MQVIKSAGPKSSAGRGERRLLRAVTIGQTALTLALLVGAGLLIRTTSNLSRVPSGYNVDRILTMTVTAVQGDWNNFHTLALERVSALAGVQRAAFAWGVPLTGNNWPGRVEIEGQPPIAKPSDAVALPVRSVTPGYFDILGIPSTRAETSANDATPTRQHAVAIVNRAFADRHFPARARSARNSGKADVSSRRWKSSAWWPTAAPTILTRAPQPELYLSLWQAGAFSKDLIVRTTSDPRVLMTAIQKGAALGRSHRRDRERQDARTGP